MFNVGGPELLVILLVALIVLGPQRLPEAARTVGRVVSEIRRVSTGFQDELRNALDQAEKDAREADAVPLASTVAAVDVPGRDGEPTGSDGEPTARDATGEPPALAPAVDDALGEIVGDSQARPAGRDGDSQAGDGRAGEQGDEVRDRRAADSAGGERRAAS